MAGRGLDPAGDRHQISSPATSRRRLLRPAEGGSSGSQNQPRAASERSVLPLGASLGVSIGTRPAETYWFERQHPVRWLAPGRGREAVRAGPRLREAAQRSGGSGVHRPGRVPDRSLPRQGDCPEHLWRFDSPTLCSTPVWNSHFVDSVQITMAEDIGSRPGPVSSTRWAPLGTWSRITCCNCWRWSRWKSPPVSRPPRSGPRNSRYCGRSCLRRTLPDTPRARQYLPGWVGGRRVAGYLQEPGIPEDSTTETFVALRLGVQNRRWPESRSNLRAGKRLPRRSPRWQCCSRQAPHLPFAPADVRMLGSNQLVIRVQPDEG